MYDRLHPELYNRFEQRRISGEIVFIADRMPGLAEVLDIGCGTGNILLKLVSEGLRVWGVDISADMLNVLKRRIPNGAYGRVRLIEDNVENFLKGCSVRFDAVTMSSVLHHLPDYLGVIEYAAGLLKPGGWLYITHEPTKAALSEDPFLRKLLWHADNIIYTITHLGNMPATEQRDYRFSDYHLYHGFDEEKVLEQCRISGMEIVKFDLYSSMMRLGLSCWIDSRLLKSRRQFSIIARKMQ